jgi:hypothetical protein
MEAIAPEGMGEGAARGRIEIAGQASKEFSIAVAP